MSTCIVCQNDTVRIRRMRDCTEDYALMSAWLSDPAVLQYYEGRDNPFNLDKVIEHFGPRTRGEGGENPCILECGQWPVGYIQFYRADGEDSILKESQVHKALGDIQYQNPYGIDLFIGETDSWNKGIGTAVLRLLVDYLLDNHLADIILIDPQTWNKRAIRCYEKCGFKPLTILEKHELHEGQYRDNLIMAVRKNQSV